MERSLRQKNLTDFRQLRSQLWKLRTLKEAFLLTLDKHQKKDAQGPCSSAWTCLRHAARRHEDCRCGLGNKLQCPSCEMPTTELQGDVVCHYEDVPCNNTCTGSLHLNITPVGQVQDDNCPSYTRNAQSLHQCSTPALLAVWGLRLGFCTALWDISWCTKGYINTFDLICSDCLQ